MNDVIESVSHAICCPNGCNNKKLGTPSQCTARCHEFAARAAILETLRGMMEPSEAMKAAACELDCPSDACMMRLACTGDNKPVQKERWQAMLTQKIKEVEGE